MIAAVADKESGYSINVEGEETYVKSLCAKSAGTPSAGFDPANPVRHPRLGELANNVKEKLMLHTLVERGR